MDASKIKVELELTADTPSSMNFTDTYEGIHDLWYLFDATPECGVNLWANPEGFEHLARIFLKLARSKKMDGYHSHHTLESGQGPSTGETAELAIGLMHERPTGA
jgi:hypothetical protein